MKSKDHRKANAKQPEIPFDQMTDQQVLAGMTAKQIAFCEHYIKTYDRTKAAVLAGYVRDKASHIGWENMNKPYVIEYISRLQKELRERIMMSAEEVVAEYVKIARVNPIDFYDENGQLIEPHKLRPEVAAALSEITEDTIGMKEDGTPRIKRKYKFHSKLGALQDLGKHFGIFERDNQQRTKANVSLYLPDNQRDLPKTPENEE